MRKGKMSHQQLSKGKYFSGARTEERIGLRITFPLRRLSFGRQMRNGKMACRQMAKGNISVARHQKCSPQGRRRTLYDPSPVSSQLSAERFA